jgi:hypothetical protein
VARAVTLTVRYRGNGGLYPVYLCSGQRRDARATRDCVVLRCDLLDAAIAAKVLLALKPAELELALATLQELELALATIRVASRNFLTICLTQFITFPITVRVTADVFG